MHSTSSVENLNILTIKATDSSLASEMKEMIADDLRKRYLGSEIAMLLGCATYFDIWFKNKFVTDSDQVKERLLNDNDILPLVPTSTCSTPTVSETSE